VPDKPFAAYEGDDPFFFVCYSHEDAEKVFREMAWLEPAGFNLWYDDGIHVGSVWRQALADALSKSSGLIFFATSNSVESSNCLKELNFILDEEKAVFVVQIDDTPLPGLLRLSLSDRQALVRSQFDEETYRSRLIGALSNVVPPRVRSTSGEAPRSATQTIRTDPPSIAILPFTCLGTDQALGYLAQGVTGDLIARLSMRIWHIVAGQPEDVSVAPRELGERLGVRYLLGGTIQGGGNRVRLTVRLTDASTGREVWAQRDERTGDDLFELQDGFVNSIDFELFDPIMTAEHQRLKDVPDDDLDAWGLCARSRMPIVDRASRDRIRGLLEKAVARDPDFAFAHSLRGVILNQLIFLQFSRDAERDKRMAIEEVNTALRLAPNNVLVLLQASTVHRCIGDIDHAVHLAERATALGGRPFDSLGAALLQTGRYEDALELGRQEPDYLLTSTLVLAALASGRLEEALEWARQGTTQAPNSYLYWMYLAATQAALGRLDDARESVRRSKDIIPTMTLQRFEKGNRLAWRDDDNIVEPLMTGLRELDIE